MLGHYLIRSQITRQHNVVDSERNKEQLDQVALQQREFKESPSECDSAHSNSMQHKSSHWLSKA